MAILSTRRPILRNKILFSACCSVFSFLKRCNTTTIGPVMTATTTGTIHSATSSHPIRHRLGIIAINPSLLHGLLLTLTDSWTMKVLLTVSKPKPNGFYMAFKADFAAMRHLLSRKHRITVLTGKRHHNNTGFVPNPSKRGAFPNIMGTNKHFSLSLIGKHVLFPPKQTIFRHRTIASVFW